MRGAFGKTYGTVARVEIGQILLSVRARDAHQNQVMEALRRAKYKFPGRQRLCASENWGFTKIKRERYEELKQQVTAWSEHGDNMSAKLSATVD